MKCIDIKKILNNKKLIGKNVMVEGWLKFNRDSNKIIFIELNDGTTINNLQIVCKNDLLKNFDEIKNYSLASAIRVSGILNIGKNQKSVEIVANNIILLKRANDDYPLQNKQHTNEFLRKIAHLKSRATSTQAIMHVRHELAYAIHNFFYKNNFTYIATPIITSNDCEGAGENFCIAQDQNDPFFINVLPKLTVSGQLNAEAYALGMKKVYTFGPTFRAEKSHTNKHLAEFWMIEPEINFIDLKQLLSFIEKMFKFIVKWVLDRCKDEICFLNKKYNNNTYEILSKIIKQKFRRLDYKEAVEILKNAIANGHKFEDNDIFYGKDFTSEHEKYLCQHFQAPIFLMNFPKEIKAFYMKVNNDNKSVAASDLLVPGVGEIVGGSQRESDYDKIVKRCKEMNINPDGLQWYLDLRKYGYYKSSGFGLGFERMIMYVTGIDNIKDAIPFPRFQGELKF